MKSMTKIFLPFLCSLSLLILFSASSQAQFQLADIKATSISNSNSFVPASQAFIFNFEQKGNKVYLKWNIKSGYYLYQDKISISSVNDSAKIGSIEKPQGQPYHDEFFGQVNIYKDNVTLIASILSASNDASLKVSFQGCAASGFCYPPETITLPLNQVTTNDTDTQQSKMTQHHFADGSAQTHSSPVTNLSDNWWQPFLFLGLGIGLAFTPCVLPMYPILTSIVLGSGKKTHKQTFKLSMLYVQGMALTYTLLGLIVASAGLQFQAAFQHPYVLISLSLFFILLASSMFGLFTLQLPSSLQTKLNQLSHRQQGGSGLSVFTMGVISGLICSPCTTAPLSGALLYVAQSGDLITGAATLYALALGMGIPLIIVGMFGNKLLPKAGPWMDNVKIFFGFILLVAAIFLLERLLPEKINIWLWGLWALSVFAWIYHISTKLKPSKLASIFAIVAIIGLSGGTAYLYNQQNSNSNNLSIDELKFIQINNIADLNRELLLAKQAGKPVMLDFYADWCVACKQFEKYTFHDIKVAKQLQDFVLLQADVTKNNPQDIELLKQLNVLGLPTVDFWDANGKLLTSARLTGFVAANKFLTHLKYYQLIARKNNQ